MNNVAAWVSLVVLVAILVALFVPKAKAKGKVTSKTELTRDRLAAVLFHACQESAKELLAEVEKNFSVLLWMRHGVR